MRPKVTQFYTASGLGSRQVICAELT